MQEINIDDIIAWLQHSIENCDKSVAFYKLHPEKDKEGLRTRDMLAEKQYLQKRIKFWSLMQ